MKIRMLIDEADKLLGFSFSKKLFETDSTEIMDTEITQAAIFLTSVAFLPCNSKNVVNGAKIIYNHSAKGRMSCMKNRTICEDRSSRSREGLRNRV